MRILTSLLLLGYSASIFAQLNVRNNTYIYVKDEVVFVKDNINLNEADSKIYLRDESQLIQGDGTSGNSGLGELSIYQEGNVNQWSYNYWCSPVGGILTDNFLNNSFRVNQIDDPLLLTVSTIDSDDSIFTNNYNGNSTPLIISNRWLWTFVSSDSNSDWVYVGETGDVSPGLGFTMKGMGSAVTGDQTYDFRGKPNNGTIGNSIADDVFTLVGNPYPSAIDAALYIHDTDNINAIDGTLYYWEQDGTVNSHVLQDYVGGYYEFTINATGDMITDSPAVFTTYDEDDNSYPLMTPLNGVKSAGRYIPIGQGFMVKGITSTSGTVYAKNEHRVYEKEGGNSIFFRNGSHNSAQESDNSQIIYQDNGLTIVPEDYKRFRINVDFTVNQSKYTRQLVLNFHDSATAGFDRGLELSRSENFANDAYFTIDNKIYSGQAYPFDQALVIPLNVDIQEQQPLRFRIFDIQNFEENQDIYIHDVQTNTFVNLRDEDYELNIDAGNYTNRFEIVFMQQNVLDVKDYISESVTVVQNNNLQELSILNPNNLNVKSIEIVDVNGKHILKRQFDASTEIYKLSTANLSDGVYIVNIRLNETIMSQKILVKE
ncbi:T9SS type A sorting domain-containing protein [Winogradskyella ouciana]|uniref:T9SS type A sorting domain-containing protein n=1 Tax=Winogradskyella ouciana TaxID=2608631 RepID=A0A7K1GDI9_9FLAO|nr:T9SS type A sorting domain-containing protein [Winogradskyella ouciana]MTE25909.1 T9SS type A sorting domain-containing protein [Winogradskyella ouciana]